VCYSLWYNAPTMLPATGQLRGQDLFGMMMMIMMMMMIIIIIILYVIFVFDVVDILNCFLTLYMTACNILFGPSYYTVFYSIISIHY